MGQVQSAANEPIWTIRGDKSHFVYKFVDPRHHLHMGKHPVPHQEARIYQRREAGV